MIYMYTGSVGSGKSYHALELGLKILNERSKRHVIANFPIIPPKKFLSKKHKKKWDEICERWHFWEEISVERLMVESLKRGWFGKESQCEVIIDESGILFNSRDWQKFYKQRNNWIKFLALSRKWGYDFIFIAQSDRMIDKQIRGLVEYDVKHLKANNSFLFSFLNYINITLFMYIYKWYHTGVKANLRFSFYKSWIGNRYDTMRLFNQEELIEGIKLIYQGKLIPAAVAQQISIWEEQLKLKKEELEELERLEQEEARKWREEMLGEISRMNDVDAHTAKFDYDSVTRSKDD